MSVPVFSVFPIYAGSTTVSSDVLTLTSSTRSTCVYTTLCGQAIILLLSSHLTKIIRSSSVKVLQEGRAQHAPE